MRERLIELISYVQYMGGLEGKLADHLLENGVVIIDPQKYHPVNNQRIIKTVFGVPLDEMAELIDAKQEGRIIVPPCKVGQTVYCIRYDKARKPFVKPLVVLSITAYGKGKFTVFTTKEDFWCVTAFPTREEAEQALEKMKGETL